MEDLVAGLPPYLKYLVLTLVPWVELRGAVPWAVQQGDRAYLPIIVLTNMLIFWPTYFGLELLYELIPADTWLHRKLERIRAKAHPLVEKYGVVGLAIFVSIPLPGTGAYSGTAASWLLDMGWRRAFLAVCLGVLIAFGLVWGISEGIAAGVGVFRAFRTG
ncbi:MAG: small multi-drug export protein [Anaerosomatales bacterium]|nr:small multi-drug export protein [Anaerosomatales bacterium]MDT8434438.1 small multi-drug export protein [Anaerosomatales bacterium]